MLKSLLFRPVFLTAATALLLLLLALALLVGKSWRSAQRLQPLHSHIAELSRLQAVQRLQFTALEALEHNGVVDRGTVDRLRREVIGVIAYGNYLVPETTVRLQEVYDVLAQLPAAPRPTLIDTLGKLRAALDAEITAHDALLQGLQRNNVWELRIAVALLVAIPVFLAIALYRLRRRIWLPLHSLGVLMASLADSGMRPVSDRAIDPLLMPLFANYNKMVNRLGELERINRNRQEDLEAEVRTATRILLEHHQELANSERLAAVGEVAASVAHELRNPLAAVQTALENLSQELTAPEHTVRVELVLGQLRRMTQLLNALLSHARQEPEPFSTVHVAEAAAAVLAVLRYQVPSRVSLCQEIPDGLQCRLPEGRFRQALLNLVLNAAQSLAGRGGTVTVAAREEDRMLTLTVVDDGPGFPHELLASGVRPFATWREKGTGLGLAMVQRFTRDMDGAMALANGDGGGACVTLHLPCGATGG